MDVTPGNPPADRTRNGHSHVLGVDSGGSGVRIALTPVRGEGPALTWSSPDPAVMGERGIDAQSLLDRVLPAAARLLREAGAERCEAVCVGASGMATLGDDLRAVLPDALRDALGARRLALASDAVTAYAGALGQRPGAVVAVGTGLVALGTDLTPEGGWRRADGWGHLLGDCGSGAWIGRAGLEAAMRAYDGREGASPALLARLEALLGPAPELPGKLYPRADRPALLASFAPEVGRCAGTDPVAARILRDAARHIAGAAAAVCPRPDREARPAHPTHPRRPTYPTLPPGRTRLVTLTGGLLRMGEPLLTPLHRELQLQLPHAHLIAAAGDPLSGASLVAAALATDELRLPTEVGLLRIIC
ncbi:N-acetylglucosamine kinase [Streptomyces netropsis]|uniref:N-acetylglucosamine kinase n=1 Tax=Streptomyces netropsis TaxID=55404 RepID=UPI003797CC9C